MCNTVQCSAVCVVQYSAVQCRAAQCSAVCVVQYSAVQCRAAQCSAVRYSAMHYSAVQCSAVTPPRLVLSQCPFKSNTNLRIVTGTTPALHRTALYCTHHCTVLQYIVQYTVILGPGGTDATHLLTDAMSPGLFY